MPITLRTIGANQTAELVDTVNAMFDPDGPPAFRSPRKAALAAMTGNEGDGLWFDLDRAFWSYPDDLERLLREYLHAKCFAS